MKTILACLVLLIAMLAARPADATCTPGLAVIYHYDGSHDYPAVITHDYGDGSCNLVVFSWVTAAFGFGPSSLYGAPATFLDGVWEGTGSNRWEVNPAGTGPTGATGSTGATGATGAAGATGPGALVTSSSTPSLALNGSAIQLDSTHDTELYLVVKIDAALTITGGAGGTVHLLCDSSSTPTTEVATAALTNTGTITVGLALTVSQTIPITFRVPASNYCKATTTNDTGTPSFTLVRQRAQTLGS